jgi:hypothetical protein
MPPTASGLKNLSMCSFATAPRRTASSRSENRSRIFAAASSVSGVAQRDPFS